MAKTHGSIEVICLHKRPSWVKLTWLNAPWGQHEIFSKGKVFRPDLKPTSIDDKAVWVARELRIPTGEYMVEWGDKKEWIRVFEDDVTVVDFR